MDFNTVMAGMVQIVKRKCADKPISPVIYVYIHVGTNAFGIALGDDGSTGSDTSHIPDVTVRLTEAQFDGIVAGTFGGQDLIDEGVTVEGSAQALNTLAGLLV